MLKGEQRTVDSNQKVLIFEQILKGFFKKIFLGGLKISEKKVCAVCNQKA